MSNEITEASNLTTTDTDDIYRSIDSVYIIPADLLSDAHFMSKSRHWEFITALALNIMSKKGQLLYTSYTSIANLLFGSDDYKRTNDKKIKDAVSWLAEKKLIYIYEECRNGSLILDTTPILYEKGKDTKKEKREDGKRIQYYFKIRSSELHKIMNLKTNAPKSTIVKFFCTIISSLDWSRHLVSELKGKYCYKTMSSFAEQLGIGSQATINKYNKLLEDNNLISILRSVNRMQNEDDYYRPTNIYCRPEDKDLAETYACLKVNGYSGDRHFKTFATGSSVVDEDC